MTFDLDVTFDINRSCTPKFFTFFPIFPMFPPPPPKGEEGKGRRSEGEHPTSYYSPAMALYNAAQIVKDGSANQQMRENVQPKYMS